MLGVEEDGVRKEPVEEVIVDVSPELQGTVIDMMSDRKATMLEIKDIGNRSRLVFQVRCMHPMPQMHDYTS